MRLFINAMLALTLVAFVWGGVPVSARHLAELRVMRTDIAAVQPAHLRPSIRAERQPMHQFLMLLFSLAAGLSLSGIAANLYRLLARKPESRPEHVIYFAVMALAGPSVLFNNATKSFRGKACSAAAYLFAVTLTCYWSFALGAVILSLFKKF